MVDTVVESLILDLLEWLASGERSYEDVMDAWRTSCPRLPVWEEANDRSVVRATPSGLALLERQRNFQRSQSSH
jgi:D-3-phosphoglycerate dehydrogenase